MAIVTDRNYGQALTAAVAKRTKKVQDIIYKSTPLTSILFDKGNIQKYSAGGPELRIPLEYDTLTSQWYKGYDKLRITPKELLSSAVFGWSQMVSMFSLSGEELLYNQGPEQIINLLSFHMKAAEKSAKQSFEAAIVGDGTGDGGRQMLGLGAAVPILATTGTYGGINRANVAEWRTTTFNIPNGDVPGITTWDSTTVLRAIEYMVLARSRNGEHADLWVCDINSYQVIRDAILQFYRIVERSEKLARLGFEGIQLVTSAGVINIWAAGGVGNVMPANTIYALNTDDLALYTFPGRDFVPFHPGDGMRPINQDAIAQGIVWAGQMVLQNPLTTFRVVTA